jgi:dTDP-glucose 4,6-dehydratase
MADMVVTGASGFLGSNFLIDFASTAEREEAFVACPVSFRHRGIPERLTHLNWYGWLKVITADLSCPIADTTAHLLGRPQRVINFASESHIPRSMTHPAEFVKNNVDLMVNLLEWVRNYASPNDPPLFVHISTDEVYGAAVTEAGHPEWSAIRPMTPYSASKAAQEAMLMAWSTAFGIPAIIINTMNPLGLMQDPEKYLPTLIRKIVAQEEVQIHVDVNGAPGSRAYLDTRDLNQAIKALTYRWGVLRSPVSRFNVSGDRDVTNLELAQMVAKCLGEKLRYKLVTSDSPSHGARHALDTTAIRAAGWKQQYAIQETVQRVVEWTMSNPMWLNRKPKP